MAISYLAANERRAGLAIDVQTRRVFGQSAAALVRETCVWLGMEVLCGHI